MSAKKKWLSGRYFSYVLMLINTFCWGAALIIVKPALETTTPFRFLFYRFVLASILVIPLLFKYSKTVKNISQKLKTIIPLEILGTSLALSLLYLGLAQTSAIEASLLTMTTPIWIVVGGVLILKEREENREAIGLVLAVFGTALLTLFPFMQNSIATQSGISITGNLLVFLSVIAVAFYYLLAKKAYLRMPKLFVTSISFIVGAVSMLPLVIWEHSGSEGSLINTMLNDLTDTKVIVAAVYMATFGSIIGLTAYIKGQDGIEASEAALFTYLQPLIFLPLAYVLLGEKIFSVQIIALIIILIGVWIAESRIRKH